MAVKKKNMLLFIIATLIILSLLFFLGKDKLTEKRLSFGAINKHQNQISLDHFLKMLTDHEPFVMQIYYLPFSADSSGSLTEEHVVEISFMKLTLEYPVTGSKEYADYLGDTLKDISELKSNLPSCKDFRYCCLFRSTPNKCIRFSISRESPDILFINGQPYKASLKVIDTFLKLLPARYYESAIEKIIEGQGSN